MSSLRAAVETSYGMDDEGKVKLIDNDSAENKPPKASEIKVDETVEMYRNFISRMDEGYNNIDTIGITLKDYSDEFRQRRIDSIYEQMEEDRVSTGNKILNIIDERIDEAKAEQELRVRDTNHQLLISNALEMLKMLDKNATAHQINNIIAPFVEKKDYQTLSIINTFIDNKFPGELINPSSWLNDVEFPTLIVSDEFRHEKMKELFKDIMFSNTAKYMRQQGGLNHEIMIRTIGVECGYYDI